ncbi:MAG: hypothetical protein ACI4TW_06060, partial [Prevotella sp.]
AIYIQLNTDIMRTKVLHILLLSMLCCMMIQAHTGDITAERLTALGFENVKVDERDGVVYAMFEDRAYRGTWRGFGVMLQELAKNYPAATRFEVVVLDTKVPVACTHAKRNTEGWHVNVDYDVQAVVEALRDVKTENNSFGKVDVYLHPKVSIDNHRLDVLCEYAVSIAPSIETTLWRGARVTIQPVIPLFGGNLPERSTLRHLRLGIADIEQELTRGGRWSAKVAAGLLYSDMAGVHAEAGYRLTKSLGVKLQAGITGDALSDGDGYHFEKPDRVSFLAKTDWYEWRTGLQVQLTGGRFAYGDYGGRIDVTRHFGEYAIGLYGALSEGEHNAGFHFAIPMGEKRQRRNGPLRLRLPEYFNWEYSMVSYYEYAEQKMGREYRTRADADRSSRYFQAEYIRTNLQRYMDGTIR